jgi:UDP-N-acetylmuramoyl-tripeptide--D-alanyl-D-alanine ligase
MNLHQVSSIVGGTLIGKPIQFKGVSTDSRQDCSGKLFVALSGENFNGEDYCQQAIDNGAVAVLVSHSQDINTPQVVCDDTLISLSILGKNWAKQCQTKIIAITGSNGKTTVKNMVYSILSVSNKCSATQGNLNNEIGVPLTLCGIDPLDKYAIIEMGAAKLGDISWLVTLVNIHTAVITNVSAAHIGRFETFENIVSEKGEIISTLGEDDYAVLPIDDEHYALWKDKTISNVLSFGHHSDATVNTDSIKHINLPIAGKHNQTNAACAIAIAQSCDIAMHDIRKGLETFKPEAGRLENLGKHKGNTLINDSYNANPQSVKAAIDVLSEYDSPTTLVFGDMAELGEQSKVLHQEIGEYAKNKNITHLLTIGNDSIAASASFSDEPQHFTAINDLKKHLLENWNQFGTLLIKGSRSMHLEQLVNALIQPEKVA